MSRTPMDMSSASVDGPQQARRHCSYPLGRLQCVVIYRVAASLRQNESGIIERRYELRGDTLVFAADGLFQGAQVTHTLHWRRARTR